MLAGCLTVFFLLCPSPSRHVSVRSSQPQHFQQHRGERAVRHLWGPRHGEALWGFQLRWLQRLLQEECPEEPHVLLQVRTGGTETCGSDRTAPHSSMAKPSECSSMALRPLHPPPLSLTSALTWQGSVTALTLGLPSTDHWVKTLRGLAPYFRGQAHVLANGYGQPWIWPASSKMPREKPYFRDLAPHYSVL